MQQKGGDELESEAPFEVIDHGSKLAVRAQWLSALKVSLKPTRCKTCNVLHSRLNFRTLTSYNLLNVTQDLWLKLDPVANKLCSCSYHMIIKK